MEGVIPNSKVVIIPPINGHDEGEASWKRELYLRPGEWIPWVTVAVIGTTVVLAFIVLILHLAEKVRVGYCYWEDTLLILCNTEGGRDREEESVAYHQFRCALKPVSRKPIARLCPLLLVISEQG